MLKLVQKLGVYLHPSYADSNRPLFSGLLCAEVIKLIDHLQKVWCETFAALLDNPLRNSIVCSGDATGHAGEGIAVTTERYGQANSRFVVAAIQEGDDCLRT